MVRDELTAIGINCQINTDRNFSKHSRTCFTSLLSWIPAILEGIFKFGLTYLKNLICSLLLGPEMIQQGGGLALYSVESD